MPRFDVLPINEAQLNSATGKRAQILREYVSYIEQLDEEKAGRLSAGQGETLGAVRRRVGAAAKQLGKTLVIKQTDEYVFFWADSGTGRRRRRKPRSTK
jgi:hypothetical protein